MPSLPSRPAVPIPDIASQTEDHLANTTAVRIAALNDAFRKNPHSGKGRLMITDNVASLGDDFVATALLTLAGFNTFTPDNDPHGDHDFGIFTVEGVKLYFKIDYYDAACLFGSEDPTDDTKTTRVLTILLPEDY
jgi:hypothetical protein